MGIALAASLVMGAAVSYRYEIAQKQMIDRFADSVDRLESRLVATSLTETSSVDEPANVPKTFDDYTLALDQANAHFQEGHFQDAAKVYQEALKAFPSGSLSDLAHYRLGLCLVKLDRVSTAAEHFRVVTDSFQGSHYYGRAAIKLAESLIAEQKFAQARRILYSVIGARDRLATEDQESLENAFYALARTFEGEAEVIEAMNAPHVSNLATDTTVGDEP